MGKPAVLASVVAGLYSPLAHAGAVVELIPTVPGPYAPGTILQLGVYVTSDASDLRLLKFARLDFSASDAVLVLPDSFNFDLSAAPGPPSVYEAFTFPALPRPQTAMALDCVCPGYYIQLVENDALHLGDLQVELPLIPGSFLVDALNPLEDADDLGAEIRTLNGDGLGPLETWRANTGELTGGAYIAQVVPELSTACLLLGAAFPLLLACRRSEHQ